MSGYEALRGSAAWIDLSKRGKIWVLGEDRARLLHAMSTNNVKELEPGQGMYAFFLNDKGRILADAYIYNRGEDFLLDTEPETGRKLFDHLDRFIIADDVTLEDETDSWAEIGIEGPSSLKAVNGLGFSVPREKYAIEKRGGGWIANVSTTGGEGVRIFVPRAEKDSLLEQLAAAVIPQASDSEARTVRLENGMPRYGEEISERYLVQETQALHAIHFNKGCYLGQEIVERVRSRGQVHRLLTPIRIDSEAPPPAGTKLNVNGADMAEISSAAYSPALGYVVGLAYVRAEVVRDKPPMAITGSETPVAAFVR